jgi:LEA14-like dessication related protein
MNRNQIFSLVAVIGLSLGLYAYMQKQSRLIEAMDYEFDNVKLTGIATNALTMSFDLVLENTSDLDLKIYNIDFKVLWNNEQVGSVKSSESYLIQRRSTQVVPLTLTLMRSEMNQAIAAATSNLQTFLAGRVRISGNMDVGADFLTIKDYPFEYEDTASNLVGNSIGAITNLFGS